MSEQMTYKMQPAGHEEPPKKREYPQPDRKWTMLFEEWMKATEKIKANVRRGWNDILYKASLELLKKGAPTTEETYALIVSHQCHPIIKYAGFFLSAVYAKRPEKVFVYDHDFETLRSIGTELPAGKTLVNLGTAGDFFGHNAFGNVINMNKTGQGLATKLVGLAVNYGKSDLNFAGNSTGTAINLGETGTLFGEAASGCIIEYQAPGSLHYYAESPYAFVLSSLDPVFQKLLRPKKLIVLNNAAPEIHEYFENLRHKLETARNDYRKAIEVIDSLGTRPGKRIKNDLEAMLMRAENV